MEETPAEVLTDVLIVGAGPVGMTLALTLRRAGVSVCVVDRESKTGQFTRAAIVWPRTLELLNFLGIAGDWQKSGVAIQNAHLTIDGSRATLAIGENDSPFPHPRGIGQDETEALLDAHVRESGADYRRGVEATQIVIEESGVSALLQNTDGSGALVTVRAQWIVGCDGSRSSVRAAMGVERTGHQNVGMQLVQGDFLVRTSQTLIPGDAYLWTGKERLSVLFILPVSPDGHCRILVAQPDDGTKDAPTTEQIAERARLFVPDIVLSDPLWHSRYRTQQQIADAYRKGRAFVVGDAAHVWVPIGGQGMNIGMQDAFDLGWKLAGVLQNQLPEAVLDTYQTERHPVGERNIADTDRLYHAVLNAQGWEDTLLRRLMPIAVGFSPIAERVAARFAGLDVQYPESLIVAQNERGGIANGTRLPDAWVSLLPQGETVSLHRLLTKGEWLALGWITEQNAAEVIAAETLSLQACSSFPVALYLVDATEQGIPITKTVASPLLFILRDKPHLAADACHITHSVLYLIRPDGIVAWHGTTAADAAGFLQGLKP